MATAASSPSRAEHLLTTFGHELPFHALPRLVCRSGNLLKRLVKRQVVSDRVLRWISPVQTSNQECQSKMKRTCQPVAGWCL